MEYVEVRTQAELDKALKKVERDEIGRPSVVPVCVGNGHFSAYGSASVRADGSASVWAYDSASVWAYGSASVRAYGSASVEASKYVAVQRHTRFDQIPTVNGGVLIDIPTPVTAKEWCEFYGAEVKDGVATLFKAVDGNFKSGHGWVQGGFDWTPGTVPEAPDWDLGRRECGGGLHFCPRPGLAASFYRGSDRRFVACPISLEDIVVHQDAAYPTKVKAAKCCAPVYEVDIDGVRVGSPSQEEEAEAVTP